MATGTPAAAVQLILLTVILVGLSVVINVHGRNSVPDRRVHNRQYLNDIHKLESFKASLVPLRSSLLSTLPSPDTSSSPSGPRVFRVTTYGADPTGKTDSIKALITAISDAFNVASDDRLIEGIVNLGGAQIDLEGGIYMISRPLTLPKSGRGNFVICGGTIKASKNFSRDGYLLEMTSSASNSGYNYEYVTLRDVMFDSNFNGGGVKVINSLRVSIENCYFAHFTTTGVLVQGGHETNIRNSFLGQRITAGGDPSERTFSGTAINLASNDNLVVDVVIFSASIGILISGQANLISGVHCYNKATGFGGTGIYLRLPGLTQTRIVDSYLDYTGIVAEDPVQLHVSNCFFLGNAYIVLKSINGQVKGVNIVDNMFSGGNKGIEIVQLDEKNRKFKDIDQVIVDRNNVDGMKLKATVARASVEGNGTSWTVDFNQILLFRDLIKSVQYTLRPTQLGTFPNHALRNISNNRIVIEAKEALPASVYVSVDQGASSL